jgi:hypothetical protein
VLGGTATVAGGAAMGAGAMMTAAAIGGAVGSVASQAVGLATGAIQSFSWRGVATSALTAGIGAGVGSVAQFMDAGKLLTAAASGLGSSVANASINGGFSWRQVAANVVGNAIGSAVGSAVGGALSQGATTAAGQFAAGLTSKFVGGMVSMHARRKLGSDEAVNYGNVAADAFANTLVDRWTGVHKTQAALAAQNAKREAAIAHAGCKAGRREAAESARIDRKLLLRQLAANDDQAPFSERHPGALASLGVGGWDGVSSGPGFWDQANDFSETGWGEPLTPVEQARLAASGGYKLGGVVGMLESLGDDAAGALDAVMDPEGFVRDAMTVAGYGGGTPFDTGMAAGRMRDRFSKMPDLIGAVLDDPMAFGAMLAKDELADFQGLLRQHNQAVREGDYYEAGKFGGAAAYKAVGYVLAGYGLAKTAANVGRLTVNAFRKLSANLAELRSIGNYNPANLADVDVDLDVMDAAPRERGVPASQVGTSGKWVPQPGFQRPAPDMGRFVGDEGNSVFQLSDKAADAHGVPRGSRVPWREGVPDFSDYAVPGPSGVPKQFNVSGMTGDHAHDRRLMIEHIASQANMSRRAVSRWQSMQDVALHHAGRDLVQIVPSRIHSLHHSGGAHQLRGGN